ncbi:MAG: restriction endonuclease, partial [Marinilabiliales bacterium]
YARNIREYEVHGMPVSVNPSGIGYADYVLWGDNGLPLAVIEAKKTSRDIGEGKHQAELYANCLEKMTGRRPVIFYTNGYETELWDDTFYPPRKVYGFYTKEELELLINRRKDRKDLRSISVNDDITNRYYQKIAIQNVSDKVAQDVAGKLRGASRAALVVMATGTGKTRTAISLVDIMVRANWAKRVLFLADRNALVTQAKRNFEKLLPNLTSIDLTKENEDKNTRLVFSTYPTIMNKIDGVRTKEERFYTIGHFDLIIVDEAHRSVYQKYRAIFEYFDAMMLGLTATPKDDTDHDTYDLFDEEFQVPTYNYDLDDAISDEFLKPYNGRVIDLDFMSRGVKYEELSDVDKIKYEETFRDEAGNMPMEINATALNEWLFNANTIDKVLHYLMNEGVKVGGGDKIGKTIIFARSHTHAVYIEERFNKQYPQFGNKFLRIIDNYEKYAQDLIDDFSLVNKKPQIAVSVDMLDTGIDIPEIVNLVLFKPVYSKSKFWQMIGRGTRLCPDLFGPGQDKEEFKVFDFCGNFDFFKENAKGREAISSDSISAKTFKTIIRIAEFIRDNDLDEEYQEVRNEYLQWCCSRVKALNKDSFTVKMALRYAEKFSVQEQWFKLSDTDIHDIFKHVAPLIFLTEQDEAAKRFDLMILNFKLSVLEETNIQDYYEKNVRNISGMLLKLVNINEVARQKEFLRSINTDEYWKQKDIFKLEDVRKNIRNLLKYIPKNDPVIYESDLTDKIIAERIVNDAQMGYGKSKSYKQKIERYIRDNRQNVIISKIHHNVKLTSAELEKLEEILFNSEIGTKEDYDKAYGEKPLCVLVRNVIGMDEESVMKEFSDFLNSFQLRPDQMEFIKRIVKHFAQNGIIELKELAKPPYTDLNDQGLFGIFNDERQDRVIEIIEKINAVEKTA